MPEYILKLIAEAENHVDSLELIVNGEIPKKDDIFTLEKEYPACIITYRVTGVSPMNIKIPKKKPSIYTPDMQVVSALREPDGFKKK